ncbi:MAG: M48 family metallopeptidase [Ferruginibacter sp.]|nr:M48 family metallopeptidase [Rhodoferax sp.]
MKTQRGWGLLLGAALLATPLAWARDGVEVGGNSAFSKLVSAEAVEQTALSQYQQTLQQAQQQQALAPANHPQLLRLRRIADRIIPFTADWNPRAKDWQWKVNLIGSNQINAWCMPGGKIAFYTGILDKLKLTDDEVAAVMGHEIAHALREHARERMGKSMATNVGANLLSQLLGTGQLGNTVIGGGAQLLSLQFSRSDETEADLVGLELAARAGFDPRGGITLWKKMAAQNNSAPPQWLSTHPAGSNRIAEMQKNLPRVLPLYEQAKKS